MGEPGASKLRLHPSEDSTFARSKWLMVNTNVRAPRTLDGDNTDSIEEATTFSVECAQPVGAGQERKLA